MQDEPTREQILNEVVRWLGEDVLPNIDDRGLAFEVRVAAHLLGTLLRESATEEVADAQELDGLIALGVAEPASGSSGVRAAIETGRARLAARIRGGEPPDGVDAWLTSTLRDRLRVSNPRFRFDMDLGDDEWPT